MSEKSGSQPPPSQPEGADAGVGPGMQDDPLRGSRTSGVWIATAGIGVLLVLLVIFIVQNTQEVDIRYLGWDGRLPLGAALLIAAAAGILITTAAGALRIIQLRHRVKRENKKLKKAGKAQRKQAEQARTDQSGQGQGQAEGQQGQSSRSQGARGPDSGSR